MARLLLFTVLLLSGCTTLYVEIDENVDLESASWQEGKTGVDQVLAELGPPSRLTATPGGYAFLYEKLFVREMQLGTGGREGWWQLLKLSMADCVLSRRVLVLHFDGRGVLRTQARLETTEGLGQGGSIQTLVTLSQIVDTSTYENDTSASLDWGRTLLAPLPRGLNRRQSLTTGAGGFEVSGTSEKIGQHTLEQR